MATRKPKKPAASKSEQQVVSSDQDEMKQTMAKIEGHLKKIRLSVEGISAVVWIAVLIFLIRLVVRWFTS